MENLRRHFGLAVLVSELGHVFCCVLPTVFTVLSFAANIGLIGAAPGWMMALHARIHSYEVPIIVFSGTILVLGWIADFLSHRIDCRDTGCGHTSCDTEKKRNHTIMIIASCLFAANLFIYIVIHKNMFHIDAFSPVHAVREEGPVSHD